MKQKKYSVWLGVACLLLTLLARAEPLTAKSVLSVKPQWMTARDVVGESFSNITIKNNSGSAVTVYGLYVNQLASTTGDCAAPTVMYSGSPAMAGGAFVTPVPMGTNQTASVGQNYLYNMIYGATYFSQILTSNNPVCFLPGCTWDSDTSHQWCIYLGVLSPASSNTASTANVPPYGEAVSGASYHYDLVTQYQYIGPITCNDETLTCSVATAQTVAFPQG